MDKERVRECECERVKKIESEREKERVPKLVKISKKGTAYSRLDCCCTRSTNCTHPYYAQHWGPVSTVLGPQVDPLVGWRCCY